MENRIIYSFSSFGFEGTIVKIETELRRGIPAYDIVGIADGQVKETRERIRAAFGNSNLELPQERILQSLSPADLRKEGTAFELPMALSILNEKYRYELDENVLAMGELDLAGDIRPVRGIRAAVESAKKVGINKFIVPKGNEEEALSVDEL